MRRPASASKDRCKGPLLAQRQPQRHAAQRLSRRGARWLASWCTRPCPDPACLLAPPAAAAAAARGPVQAPGRARLPLERAASSAPAPLRCAALPSPCAPAPCPCSAASRGADLPRLGPPPCLQLVEGRHPHVHMALRAGIQLVHLVHMWHVHMAGSWGGWVGCRRAQGRPGGAAGPRAAPSLPPSPPPSLPPSLFPSLPRTEVPSQTWSACHPPAQRGLACSGRGR